MDARGPESSEASYFERALVDAMHSASREVEPVALDLTRLDRRARAWRSASAVAFATGAACLLAAAVAGVAAGNLSLLPGPAGEVVAGSLTPSHADAAGSPVAPTSQPAGGSTSSPGPTRWGEAATAAGTPAVPEPPPTLSDVDQQPGEGDSGGPAERCVQVADGSAALRELVLATARQQVDAWLARYEDGNGRGDRDGRGDGDDDDGDGGDGGGPPGWLLDLSDDELLERLDMAEVVERVERDDIVDCGGGLRYASPDDGDLDQVIPAAVATELADELRHGSSRHDPDDDDSGGDSDDD